MACSGPYDGRPSTPRLHSRGWRWRRRSHRGTRCTRSGPVTNHVRHRADRRTPCSGLGLAVVVWKGCVNACDVTYTRVPSGLMAGAAYVEMSPAGEIGAGVLNEAAPLV